MQSEIKRAVLTGGPCAGKTTAKSYLRQKLGDFGFHPLFVPEAPTLLIENGVTPIGGVFAVREFQRSVLSVALKLEDEVARMSKLISKGKPIVVGDRGIVDQRVYLSSDEEFEELLSEHGLTFAKVLGERYEGVFHLRTAALGAEEFYTLENNAARFETAEEARITDQRTLNAWMGHEHLRIIPNEGSFEKKMKRLLAEICALIGIPEPVETERKFLVGLGSGNEAFGACQEVDIEQFYLMSGRQDEELRFRKRSQWGHDVFFKTRKRPGADPSSRFETETRISAADYEFGKQFQQPGTRVIRKKRLCFVYREQYFELDSFIEPVLPYRLLEIELAHPEMELALPPVLNIKREVTGDKRYGNRALSIL